MRDSHHPEGKVSECAVVREGKEREKKGADLFWPISLLQLGESFVPTVQFYTATGDSIFV